MSPARGSSPDRSAVALGCMTAERFDAQSPRVRRPRGHSRGCGPCGRAGRARLDCPRMRRPPRRAWRRYRGDRPAPGSIDELPRARSIGRDARRVPREDRGGARGGARLVRADANRGWPVEDGSVKAVFASRVVHLLDCDHVRSELERVCVPGGYFLVGHVSRDNSSRSWTDTSTGTSNKQKTRAYKDLPETVVELGPGPGANLRNLRPGHQAHRDRAQPVHAGSLAPGGGEEAH